MLNKLCAFIREYDLVQPGDRVICAVSGGADSVALLFALYLLQNKLKISVAAAHFNHRLRGQESQRDEDFVRQLCSRYEIPLYVGSAEVVAGSKGLEAAAREARYGYFATLPGKLATAHTADDNSETLLMHLIRGTGLKGLGGIAPVRGSVIRPMLSVTRQEVLDFLQEYHLQYVEDSTNATDDFLRNRIRHHVMPLLAQENPSLCQSLSATALQLRRDEQVIEKMAQGELPTVSRLRQLDQPVRRRYLIRFLKQCGVKEPHQSHIALVEELVFSQKPSAVAELPGGVRIARCYDRLELQQTSRPLKPVALSCPGEVELEGMRISCRPAQEEILQWNCFTVCPQGQITVRSRQTGDEMRLSGGRKTLKKLFADRKLPAAQRCSIPVLADEKGVLGVWGIGANLDRICGSEDAVEIRFEEI